MLLFEEYRDRVLTPERATIMARFRPESPHNVPLAIAGGVGIPALLLYLVLTVGVALMLVASTRRSAGIERVTRAALLAAIMGHFVTDLFMTADVTGSWLFWVYLGAGRALADACAECEPSGATRSELSLPLRQDPSPAR